MSRGTRPSVLVAEANAPMRAGLRALLARAGFEIAGEPADAESALAAALAEPPDLALVAAELPGGGIVATRRLTARLPRTRVIVLTAAPDGDELVEAVLAGAAGYVARETSPARLPEVLRAVLAGEVALPRRHSQRLLDLLRRRDARRAALVSRTGAALTDREWEVLELMADGVATAEIARRLGISAVTTRRHVSSLVAKLGVRDRAAAVELLIHGS
jgi:DNA-binding NarL/FixJ family response regulator